jgi:hypothetical protein
MGLTPEHFFTDDEKLKLQGIINKIEARTAGRIRLHVESRSGESPFKRAREVFESYGLKENPRCSLLFYISVLDRRFVVFSDDALNEKVPAGFWEHITDSATEKMHKREYFQAVSGAIEFAGEMMAGDFPSQSKTASGGISLDEK